MTQISVTSATSSGTGASLVAAAFGTAIFPITLKVTNRGLFDRDLGDEIFAPGQIINVTFDSEAALAGMVEEAIQASILNGDAAGMLFETIVSDPVVTQPSPKTADFDTGAGTDTVEMLGIALPKSGGAVAGGTASDPLRTDPTGTTTQPVSLAGAGYETVAAGQTDQVLGATGAAGDRLDSLTCVVATAATSGVSIKDGAGSAISVLPDNVGGGVGTYTIHFPRGLVSASGAWKVTTGAGVSVIAAGQFAA
jgi:hypothetical protein